ncbi:mogroside IE synthase [Pyrus x bretschneideri]|uniref:mogroside IE synthase n=1 Tax=Pyrus x bretschneideri TaxID=225117 RepID=UPI0005117FF9|nr:mogroside IE synthase [Pyrus x bretschneideri]
MEKEKERANRIHILVVPLPVQGHINPMLQFSKRLASKGLRVTLVTISSNAEAIETQLCKVKIEPIHATSEEEEEAGNNVENKVLWFQTILSRRLPQLILKQENDGYPVICLVYDSAMPWVLDTAKGLGIFGASFFTHSCAVGAVYYNVHEGLLRVPLKEPTISLPGLPLLEPQDLPSFIYDPGSYPSFLNLVVSRFSNITGADWIFFNTFHGLEKEVVNWMRTQWPIKTIGPTLPSMYLDKRLEDDKEYGLSVFNPNTEACNKWLESKETGTVVYVSFGSMANLGEKQMEEIALGLKRSNANFLWVVRESETQKLPSNFEEQTSEKGLVVNWCPQLEVLGHRALGCFMTHCGWNSTLEALSCGVPMVAMPQWTDQTTNAKFVEDEWKVGVRVKVDQMGIVTKEEIERCIAEVIEGERGKEIKRNSMIWRELAKAAMDEGGSSDKNIEEFVATLSGKSFVKGRV